MFQKRDERGIYILGCGRGRKNGKMDMVQGVVGYRGEEKERVRGNSGRGEECEEELIVLKILCSYALCICVCVEKKL